MIDVLLSVTGLTKRFGGIVASASIDLDVGRGRLHAIIGPNGAGKTTLVAQLAGQLRPDSGTIRFDGVEVTHLPAYARARRGFARSFQITNVVRELTTLDNVALAVQAHAGHSFRFWHPARKDSGLRAPAENILRKIGLDARADDLAGQLSHGEKRALEIGMALATSPQLLLLDEPLAGMGPEESARMVRLLATIKSEATILLVEHDMDAVFALADTVSVLVFGRIIATGTPAEVRANPEVQRAYLGDEDAP
jgi:branched-chain amino acid transport system ATP-binding protein